MRVIAGKYGRRRLQGPRGLGLRPTSDRLRETLFDILGEGVAGSFFIDGFAGTGAVGIEALSRDARHVIFIEQNPRACRLIRANLAALDAGGRAELIAGDVARTLAALAARGASADFLFLDPPYREAGKLGAALDFLGRSSLLGPGATLIVEHPRKSELPERVGGLVRTRAVKQGDAALSFYRRGPTPA
jgi:16S rRNA (guanine966-N2)-methyltransferase